MAGARWRLRGGGVERRSSLRQVGVSIQTPSTRSDCSTWPPVNPVKFKAAESLRAEYDTQSILYVPACCSQREYLSVAPGQGRAAANSSKCKCSFWSPWPLCCLSPRRPSAPLPLWPPPSLAFLLLLPFSFPRAMSFSRLATQAFKAAPSKAGVSPVPLSSAQTRLFLLGRM